MNINGLLSAVKNHELVILSNKELKELLGIKRLDNNVINELTEELDLLGYVIIPIRYNSSSNGLTDVRKVVIVKKNTYLRIVREKDRNAIARAIIDYVMSNKHLFTANIKGDGNVLKIPTSIIRRLLKYIGLNNQYIDTRMGSIVLMIRTLLEVSGYRTELKRAMGRMNSIIYAYEDGEDGNPRVPATPERLLNPPAKSEAGGKHVGNKSNPGSGEVRENKEEGADHEEFETAGAGPNGTVGTTPRVRGSVGREGKRDNYTEAKNREGRRKRTYGETRGGHK
jgi:hypothetical protein